MDKYTEMLKDFARLIADTDRENFLLKHELEKTKALLDKANAEIDSLQDGIAKMIVKINAEEDANA